MMKNGVILYQSKYGATKKYAEWIVEATGFDCIRTKEADINKVAKYDAIILAGGIYASGIAGISFLKKNISTLKNKKIAVFCVGASPYDEGALSQIREHNFKVELQGIPCYYGRGMWNEEKMSFIDRTLCKMLQKAVAKQEPDTFEPWQKALMDSIGEKSDWTDREYLKPLWEWIEADVSALKEVSIEKIYAYAYLCAFGLAEESVYDEYLHRIFLGEPQNELLNDLEAYTGNFKSTLGRLNRYFDSEAEKFNSREFGKTLCSGLEAVYNSDNFNLKEFCSNCYKMWLALPEKVQYEKPFVTLCSADDDLKYCPNFGQEMFDYYK